MKVALSLYGIHPELEQAVRLIALRLRRNATHSMNEQKELVAKFKKMLAFENIKEISETCVKFNDGSRLRLQRKVTNMKFQLGKVVATSNAVNTFTEEEMLKCLAAYDWGVGEAEKINELTINHLNMVRVYYRHIILSHNRRIWIITDAADDEG